VQRDVLQALATDRTAYDLILCDPPYGYLAHDRLAPYLARALAPEGLLVYETGTRESPEIQGLSVRTSRTYGSARLTLFEH
jgi:16S rRNA G966 N2-methylase RsmD